MYYLKTWWIPIATNGVTILVFLIAFYFKRNWIIDLAIIIYFLNLLGTIISSITLILIRKWIYLFFQIGFTILIFSYVSMLALGLPDYYGTHKVIPTDIDFNMPLKLKPSRAELKESIFTLVNYGQPGNYRYYTNFQANEKGLLFIKIFEVTSNDRLSKDRILKESEIKTNIKAEFYQGRFTIYEGDWGDKYGGRVELWFQSSLRSQAIKIAEQNYIIEGWQR